MDVKRGYKQTEVGVIPESWPVISFAQAVRSYIDYRGRTPKKLGLSWGGGDILALSANNVQMGRIDPNQEAYFGSEELYRKWMVHGECQPGDVLLTMEAPLGNVAQIPDSRRYILSQRVLLIKTKDWLLRDYLAHYMKGMFFQAQLALNATGSTAKGIQRRKLDQIPVYLPPTKAEQGAIAEALSDADALVESLEQLVAKKRQIKQGIMQELLTGKTRLPGFEIKCGYKQAEAVVIPEDWELVDLSHLCTLQRGFDITEATRAPGTIPVYSSSGFSYFHNKAMVSPPGVVTGRKGLLGRVFLINEPFWPHDTTLWVKDFRGNYPAYVALALENFHLERLDAATSVPTLNRNSLAGHLIAVPPTKAEQEAIAFILSDMDAEITALEAKLTKARQLKQGMMQELLTGRIRLV